MGGGNGCGLTHSIISRPARVSPGLGLGGREGLGRTLPPTTLRRGTGCREEVQGGNCPSPWRMRKAPKEGESSLAWEGSWRGGGTGVGLAGKC